MEGRGREEGEGRGVEGGRDEGEGEGMEGREGVEVGKEERGKGKLPNLK